METTGSGVENQTEKSGVDKCAADGAAIKDEKNRAAKIDALGFYATKAKNPSLM